MDISQSSSTNPIHHEPSRTTSDDKNNNLRTKNNQLLEDLNTLQASYLDLQLESKSKDENLILVHQQKFHLHDALEKALSERNMLNDELKRVELSSKDREYELVKKIEEVVRENEEFRSDYLKAINSVKECMGRVIEYLDEFEIGINMRTWMSLDEVKINGDGDQESELNSAVSTKINNVTKIVNEVDQKLNLCKTARERVKRELEKSVMSLTEENLDLTNLLRIALVEKEAAEKSLNRLKEASEQKGVGIFKIAEKGLQKVGFGFIMGGGANEKSSDNSSPSSDDSSECEEEAVSLVSTLEGIMKDLRLEVTQLRLSLEESRSDCERLQMLVKKQAQTLSENTLYIQELEEQEKLLMQNIENLLMEIKRAGEEVARWREACELEVEASTKFVEERDRLVAIFKQELEKTKDALNISNGKLHLKEELAEAAMAAQAAAERSLRLADSRAAQRQGQIEELTRQLEEAEKRERSQRQWARHICWPWRVLKINPPAYGTTTTTTITVQNVKRMLPEMQSLPH